jgi:hypothetical protein
VASPNLDYLNDLYISFRQVEQNVHWNWHGFRNVEAYAISSSWDFALPQENRANNPIVVLLTTPVSLRG